MLSDYSYLIKNKNFIYLWISQVLSQVTINILNFLFLIRIYSETGSTIATSFLWIVYALPALFVGPFASASVDMFNRKKLLMFTNLFQAVIVFFYFLLHNSSLFLLYFIAIVYSFLNQFYVPAEQSALPSLTKKEHFPQANGLFLLTQQSALVVGFGIAGLLFYTFGFSNSVLFCAILLFIAFVSVSLLPNIKTAFVKEKKFDTILFKFTNRVIEGYRYIKSSKYVYSPFALLVFIHITLAVVAVNSPKLAIEIFSVNIEKAGIYIVVPAGVGAVFSSLLIPKLLKAKTRKIVVLKNSLFAMTASLLFMSLILPDLTGTIKSILGFSMLFALGMAFIGIVIPAQTFLQENTPYELRGRVFGNIWYFTTVLTVFPVLLSGTITELFGARMIIFILAFIFLFVYIYMIQRKMLVSRAN